MFKHGLVLVLLLVSKSLEAADISGLWLQCQNGMPVLLEIRQSHEKYVWLLEWRQADTASGNVEVTDRGSLLLKGCKAYRGVYDLNCDVQNPPTYLKLPSSFLEKSNPITNNALRHHAWIKTNAPNWKTLAKRCEDLYL